MAVFTPGLNTPFYKMGRCTSSVIHSRRYAIRVEERLSTDVSYVNVNVCKCIRNWPLPIGAFQDQCKQTVVNKHN